jgi:elongator complex protein 3
MQEVAKKPVKPTRMLSGVHVFAVMAKPYPCPHGKCLYCPGGPDKGTPQSYVGNEPALMRAMHAGFDPYLADKA